jgi:hypothetical protein
MMVIPAWGCEIKKRIACILRNFPAIQFLRPVLMNVQGSKKLSRKAYAQLGGVKTK